MLHRDKSFFVVAMACCALLLSCGARRNEVESPTPQGPPPPAHQEDNHAVEGLLGKIDDSIVEELFTRYSDRILHCYQYEALEVLEEIEGDLTAFIDDDQNGRVTTAWFVGGKLGSSPAQRCLLNVIASVAFPPPIGGTHAEMFYTMPFDEPYQHPKPFDWSNDAAASAVLESNRDQVDACLNGSTDVTLTLYVGPGGRVLAAGGTGASMDGYQASECLSQAAMSWKFANPGKHRPAKITFRF